MINLISINSYDRYKIKDSYLLDDLVNMHYVVGYQCPIHPIDYHVNVAPGKDEHTLTIVSSYDVTRADICGVPFNF